MKKLVPLIFLFSSVVIAEDCEITGQAILWAYDSCFWEYETDDSIHPGVIECVEKAQAGIERIGECESKRIFKTKICDMARKWDNKAPGPETCMKTDIPLGPAVRDGGI
jgi:hypothetical protein